MELDESRIYTAVNANEVKSGCVGYFADTLSCLRKAVEQEDREAYGEIKDIGVDSDLCRFYIKGRRCYNLFYLVEEPKKEEFRSYNRSYNDVNEMIEDFEKRFHLLPQIHQLPIIWIKNKDNGQKSFILDYSKTIVTTSTRTMSMEYLFEHYVYLDDSPCGIKED